MTSKKATDSKPAAKAAAPAADKPEAADEKKDAKPKMSMAALKAELDAHMEETAAEMVKMKQENADLKAAVADMGKALEGFKGALQGLEDRFGRLEVSAPPVLRAMDVASVMQVMEKEPYAEFEVLQTWKHANNYLPSGRIIRADHYPMLVDFVRAGLKLGVPQDQQATIDMYKKQADARVKAAKDEAIARAEKAAADAKAEADALKAE